MAKQAEVGVDLDRISNFPDEILCHIISFLHTQDAVCTSILSTRRRYLFASMSKLDFGDDRFSPRYQSRTDGNAKNFMNFVDRLMFFPTKATLECFWLNFLKGFIDSLRVYGWICAALWRGVKELDLQLRFVHNAMLPTLLYTSKSLVTLKLCMPGFDLNVPTKVCFPNLKTLDLQIVIFSDKDSVQRLFSSCIVLEELLIFACQFHVSHLRISNPSLKRLEFYASERLYGEDNYLVVIDAPCLVYFKCFDHLMPKLVYSLRDMQSLVEADLIITCPNEMIVDHADKRAANEFLQAICNVKSLRLNINLPEQFNYCLVFPNLVELEIGQCGSYYWGWQGRWLLEFLRCSPNLRSLLISMEYKGDGVWSPPERVPYCLLNNLKEIKMLEFNGDSVCFV